MLELLTQKQAQPLSSYKTYKNGAWIYKDRKGNVRVIHNGKELCIEEFKAEAIIVERLNSFWLEYRASFNEPNTSLVSVKIGE